MRFQKSKGTKGDSPTAPIKVKATKANFSALHSESPFSNIQFLKLASDEFLDLAFKEFLNLAFDTVNLNCYLILIAI